MTQASDQLARIVDQLRRSVHGGAWHGPSVQEVLEGVQAQSSCARPLPGCHSPWEILLHMTAWTRATGQTLDGGPLHLSDAEDWPPITDTSTAAWERARAEFLRETERLIDRLESLDSSLLSKTVPGRDYDYYMLLHGIVQHNLYHAGQIRLLTK